MRPDWDELFELLSHALIACLVILLLCWALVEVMQ